MHVFDVCHNISAAPQQMAIDISSEHFYSIKTYD